MHNLLVTALLAAGLSAGPTRSLLMRRFDVSPDQKYDTIATVTNTSDAPRVVRLTLWSDHDVALFWMPLTFAAKETKSIGIGKLLLGHYVIGGEAGHPLCGAGLEPPAPDCRGWAAIPWMLAQDVRCLLIGGHGTEQIPFRQPVSERHARWIGYATFDVAKDETSAISPDRPIEPADVLIGSFEQHVNGEVRPPDAMVPRDSMPAKGILRKTRERLPDVQCHTIYQ